MSGVIWMVWGCLKIWIADGGVMVLELQQIKKNYRASTLMLLK